MLQPGETIRLKGGVETRIPGVPGRERSEGVPGHIQSLRKAFGECVEDLRETPLEEKEHTDGSANVPWPELAAIRGADLE